MRKIEREMVLAVARHKAWHGANTAVEINGERAQVFLHGNCIAVLDRVTQLLEFRSCGSMYWSRTTFSRQNALSVALCGGNVGFFMRRGIAKLKTGTAERDWSWDDTYSTFASGLLAHQ